MTSVQITEQSSSQDPCSSEPCGLFQAKERLAKCLPGTDGDVEETMRSIHLLIEALERVKRHEKMYRSSESLESQSKNVTTTSASSLKRSRSWPSGKLPPVQRSSSGCGTSVSHALESDSDSDSDYDDDLSSAAWEDDSVHSVERDPYNRGLSAEVFQDYRQFALLENYPDVWLECIDDLLMQLSEPLAGYVLCNTNRLPFRFRAFHREIKDGTGFWPVYFKRRSQLLLQLPYNHGAWDPVTECVVCYRILGGLKRLCCGAVVCEGCLNNYFTSKIENDGVVQISCPACPQLCEKAEITFHLPRPTKDKFCRFLIDANNDPRKKTCPNCSHITERPKDILTKKEKKYGLRVQCSQCSFEWCFSCHAPVHTMSCAKYRSGDILLRHWTKQLMDGQANNRNARKCPGCNVFIQRSEGCNHMQCSNCGKRFCYACGSSMRRVFIIGSHNVRLSVLGCSQSFLPSHPHLRRLTRGSLLSLGLLISPVVAVGAGCVGLVFLAYAGGRFISRKLHRGRHRIREWRAHAQSNRDRMTDAEIQEIVNQLGIHVYDSEDIDPEIGLRPVVSPEDFVTRL